MNWITNHPKPLKGMWPRRVGCEYIEGDPKSTATYSTEELKVKGYIGVYVDMPIEEYKELHVVRNPRDLELYYEYNK